MVEIERKFLIKTDMWKPLDNGTPIKQGYLSVDPERVVRVRVAGEKAFLTIKGKPEGIVRTELEYEIPKNEAEVLLKLCLEFPIEKTRYKERIGNIVWEIDVFEGENKGLVLAEVELDKEDQKVDLPDWVGEEVSFDSRYYNAWLSRNPFSKW
jgi:adenylate cyclase